MAQLLREHFIAVAIDNANCINVTPAELAWLADRGGKSCTQGMTVFTASGKLLGSGGGFQAEPNLKMLRQALEKFRPDDEPATVEPLDANDRGAIPAPPAGGLVLYVTWKVIGGFEPAKPGTELYVQQHALGVDRLWVRKDEAEALARGEFPDSLKGRMLRYHVNPILGKAKGFDVRIRDGRLTGSTTPETGGEPAALRGVLETKDGRVTRLDVLLKGQRRKQSDFGFLAGLEAIPDGKTATVALFFSRADPADDLSRLPPHRSWRQLDAYLK